MTDVGTDELLELAGKCEREAENWAGEPMAAMLRTTARKLRTLSRSRAATRKDER